MSEKPFWIDTIAGGVGGALGVVAGSPMDVVRVRMQQKGVQGTFFENFAKTTQKEGLASLFRGLSYPLATVALQNAVTFQAYASATRYLTQLGRPEDESTPAASAEALPALSTAFAAGCFAGAVQCSVSVPQELLKIRLQVQQWQQGHPKYVGPLRLAGQVVRLHGIAGLYQGLTVTLARDIPSFGLYFALYQGLGDVWDQHVTTVGLGTDAKEILAGGAAGALAWASIYPLEVIKSRLQATGGTWGSVRAELGQEGWAVALTRGMGATLARAWFVNAAIFWGYGAAQRVVEAWWL